MNRGQMTEDRWQALARSLATVYRRGPRARRGITLLEVLVSIGVIAVGLLGVAALIPLGTFAVSETAKADRSSAMGRAAMHEVRVRDMLQRMRDDTDARWYTAESDRALDDTPNPLPDAEAIRQRYLIGQAFAIDPLFATEAAVNSNTTGIYECFPFKTTGTFDITDPNLTRLKLDIFEAGVTLPEQQLPVLNRIFTWPDDLLFDIDQDDPDRRPRQSYVWDDTQNSVVPFPLRDINQDGVFDGAGDDVLPASLDPAVNAPLVAQADGHYSWMLTAEPDPNELPNNSTLLIQTNHRQKKYTVSIVTFYKRDFTCDALADPPSERFVELEFTGTGIGGGDAVIGVSTTVAPLQEQAEEYLKVKENQWIMVTAFVADRRLDAIPSAYPGYRRIAKWYRVIRVDDEVVDVGSFTRNITLAGPDWNDAGVVIDTIRATLIEGVIGVYTTTVTVE